MVDIGDDQRQGQQQDQPCAQQPPDGAELAPGGFLGLTARLATEQAAPLPLIAPANATAISPLTTLLTTLVDEFGMTWESAQSEMLSSFGLSEFDVLHDVVIDQVLAGDSTAPQKYRT
ncbi:MAG: hypothetical protein IIA23_05525, partial [Chloroflexi bacterium]|nr:hypothetical protein [Chloroflexota bacterium]